MKKVTIQGGLSHYELIDFLKGFSILTIAIMHLIQTKELALPSLINKAASFGGTGVHVFFLCSGFGVYFSYKKRNLSWKSFFKRRFFKIYIPYIVVILISVMFPFMYTGNDKINALMSHVLFYKMFVSKYESSFGYQMWYISTLFQFYLVFVPLCLMKKKFGNTKFGFICGGTSVIWWITTAALGVTDIRIWGSFFLQYLWEFAIGMILADYLSKGNSIDLKIKQIVFFAVVGTFFATLLKLKGGFLVSFNDCFALSGYISIAILVYMLDNKIVNRAIYFISNISYEWYLVHVLVYISFFQLLSGKEFSKYIIGVIAFLTSIILSFGYKKIMTLFLSRCARWVRNTS